MKHYYEVKLYKSNGYTEFINFSKFMDAAWFLFVFKIKFYLKPYLDFIHNFWGKVEKKLVYNRYRILNNVPKEFFDRICKKQPIYMDELIRNFNMKTYRRIKNIDI
jgi:hypothetical protein